jgi:hypothetical protein
MGLLKIYKGKARGWCFSWVGFRLSVRRAMPQALTKFIREYKDTLEKAWPNYYREGSK